MEDGNYFILSCVAWILLAMRCDDKCELLRLSPSASWRRRQRQCNPPSGVTFVEKGGAMILTISAW